MIRAATVDDLPRILAITNHEILTGTALWNITPATLETRGAWMQERLQAGFPVLVAELDGCVQGFGSYGPFRPHDGFRQTVEHSLYVDPAFQRRGQGDALLGALVGHATAAENTGSIALHARHGFAALPPLPQVGAKFGRWLDLVFVHRLLG
jgi:L-amino acid N-acyltransferase YncA